MVDVDKRNLKHSVRPMMGHESLFEADIEKRDAHVRLA